MLATSNRATPVNGPGHVLECAPTSPVGFRHPSDVLTDPSLDNARKRAILASWASDASAVEDRPHLRWLLGTEEPVPLDDILECLAQLDRWREV